MQLSYELNIWYKISTFVPNSEVSFIHVVASLSYLPLYCKWKPLKEKLLHQHPDSVTHEVYILMGCLPCTRPFRYPYNQDFQIFSSYFIKLCCITQNVMSCSSNISLFLKKNSECLNINFRVFLMDNFSGTILMY